MKHKRLSPRLMRVISSTLILLLLVACRTTQPSPAVTSTPILIPTSTPAPTATFTPTPIPTSTPVPAVDVLKDTDEVPRISPEDLKNRLDQGETILVVDARSLEAFETQHIAGAISVPVNQIESHLDEFPHDQEIVFY
jgi:hypothetical protein